MSKLLIKGKFPHKHHDLEPDDHAGHAKYHEEKMKYNHSMAKRHIAPFISGKYKKSAEHHEKKMNHHLGEHAKKNKIAKGEDMSKLLIKAKIKNTFLISSKDAPGVLKKRKSFISKHPKESTAWHVDKFTHHSELGHAHGALGATQLARKHFATARSHMKDARKLKKARRY